MLSEETATSLNAQKIVTWLRSFLDQPIRSENEIKITREEYKFPDIWNAISQFRSIPFLVMTKSGHALFDFFSAVPNGVITILTNNKKIHSISKLYANEIRVIQTEISKEMPLEIRWSVIEENISVLFDGYQQIVSIYVSRYVNKPRANSITIFDRDDFF